MGTYVNPGNLAFAEVADSDYVDKTGLIGLINKTIGTKNKLTCISRPRRFGKTYAAKMLTAYYDCTCDSHKLFDHRNISRTKDYTTFLNQFNVICFDVTTFILKAQQKKVPLCDIPNLISEEIHKELVDLDPRWEPNGSAEESLLRCVDAQNGKKFIFIIDEWDVLIREAKNDDVTQTRYLNLLRGWFKSISFTPKVVAAAYMTGILPIKKDGSQSAISDFKEYTILEPGKFSKYTGFSETEVRRRCKKKKMNFEEVKAWYDGYELTKAASIYNPYSVIHALEDRKCRSFWTKTSASEALTDYINMNFDDLQENIAQLIAGSEISVKTTGFQNDVERFNSKDDVLTLLIHLGYLTYSSEKGTVHIPNEEVREEFRSFLQNDSFSGHWAKLIGQSRELLKDVLNGNNEAVAEAIEKIRNENYAPQFYNNEQSLRAIIKYAFLDCIGRYIRVDEMPSGKGIADVVFIPGPSTRLPAMVVELKWNKTAGGAIGQIKNKNYTEALKPFKDNILLVGINYDEKTGKHTCEIEKA